MIKKLALVAVLILSGCSEPVQPITKATHKNHGVLIENKGGCTVYAILVADDHTPQLEVEKWPIEIEPGSEAFIPVDLKEVSMVMTCADGVVQARRGKEKE